MRRLALGLLMFALAGTAAAAAPRRTAHVYFLHGERGAAVHRSVPARTPATAAVTELLRGPSAPERVRGLTTAVPAGTRLLGLTVRGGTATVDLSRRFGSGGGSASMFARLGQLVYTLTTVPHVQRVTLRIEGRTVRVFGTEGLVLAQPLDRESFGDFLR